MKHIIEPSKYPRQPVAVTAEEKALQNIRDIVHDIRLARQDGHTTYATTRRDDLLLARATFKLRFGYEAP